MLTGEAVAALFRESAGRLVVAYSGGLDSHVLLHLVAQWRDAAGNPLAAHALHLHHALSPRADAWEAHCRAVAAALPVPFTSLKLSVPDDRGNIEARAREARYAAFRAFLEPGDRLLLGHHLDDQAETILFQLLRGAGPAARGMPARRRLGRGELVRPLLEWPRQALRAYAEAHALRWIEDESNLDPRFTRNYLRHRVIPELRARWPDYTARLAAGAGLAAELVQLGRELAELDLGTLVDREGRLEWTRLLQLTPLRQRNALRHWIERAGLPPPRPAQVLQLLHQLAQQRGGARVRIDWPGGEVRAYRRHLYLMSPLPPRESLAGVALRPGARVAAGGGVLEVTRMTGQGVRLPDDLAAVTLRYREGGERCRPLGRAGSHPLKKIYQELGVPPWLRERVPLVYVGDRIVAACGLFECHGEAAAAHETGWVFRWQMAGPGRSP